MQQQMNARSMSGPSGNVNKFDNIPLGMRSDAGRGNPNTVYAQAVSKLPGSVGHTHEIHIDTEDGTVHTFDYVYATHPKMNHDGNGNFAERPHKKSIMSMPY